MLVAMKSPSPLLSWSAGKLPRRRTGVSLHSHTLHSRESLDFIYRAAHHSAMLRAVLRRGERRFRELHGGAHLDLTRGWWTPPLAPLDALQVEQRQIHALGLDALVSLTDHDDIEAPMSLQAINGGREIPVSTEWTVPYAGTFFHLGVHNLPPREARAILAELHTFTRQPADHRLPALLSWLHAMPGTLLVFNHPLWDEKGTGIAHHENAVRQLLTNHRPWLHAIEMNGLRPWGENHRVRQLAECWQMPLISGGDRHALEPNANLNLTGATTFAEFSQEVRDGHSEVLVMKHYRRAHASRILHNLIDVLRSYDAHGLGWRRWDDRVFYQAPGAAPRSLRELWGNRPPAAVRLFERGVRALSYATLHPAP